MSQDITIDTVEVKKEYYPSGALCIESPYVNGQKHGIVKSYYESGALSSETPFVNGQKHGIEKWYYESGTLERETLYENGKKHGIERGYDKEKMNICSLTLYDKDREVASIRI